MLAGTTAVTASSADAASTSAAAAPSVESTPAAALARTKPPVARSKTAPSNTATRSGAKAAPTAGLVSGSVQLAISPWGQVEVNGQAAGTTPPLTRLTLTEGMHNITVRNEDFPPHTVTVHVQADKPVVVRHRFGN